MSECDWLKKLGPLTASQEIAAGYVRCYDCLWWRPGEDEKEISAPASWGRCHVAPPSLIQTARGAEAIWPTSYADDFCGAWAPSAATLAMKRASSA
jgi:hypothetical protein